jgi:hypothetical protein
MNRHAIDLNPTAIGTIVLDRVRSELKLQNMSADLLQDTIEPLYTDVSFDVTEDLARVSRHFETEHNIAVSVPQGFLDDFVDTTVVAERDDETGETLHVCIKRTASEARILTAWSEAGYPLKWGIED